MGAASMATPYLTTNYPITLILISVLVCTLAAPTNPSITDTGLFTEAEVDSDESDDADESDNFLQLVVDAVHDDEKIVAHHAAVHELQERGGESDDDDRAGVHYAEHKISAIKKHVRKLQHNLNLVQQAASNCQQKADRHLTRALKKKRHAMRTLHIIKQALKEAHAAIHYSTSSRSKLKRKVDLHSTQRKTLALARRAAKAARADVKHQEMLNTHALCKCRMHAQAKYQAAVAASQEEQHVVANRRAVWRKAHHMLCELHNQGWEKCEYPEMPSLRVASMASEDCDSVA